VSVMIREGKYAACEAVSVRMHPMHLITGASCRLYLIVEKLNGHSYRSFLMSCEDWSSDADEAWYGKDTSEEYPRNERLDSELPCSSWGPPASFGHSTRSQMLGLAKQAAPVCLNMLCNECSFIESPFPLSHEGDQGSR
jgi:hypothetical protein